MSMLISPFEQFYTYGIYYISPKLIITDMLVFMVVTLVFCTSVTIMLLSNRERQINLFKIYFGVVYNFIYNIVRGYLGDKIGNLYFPFLLYLFLFVFVFNFAGLLPNVPTLTSNFYINIGLSGIIWAGAFFIGLQRKGIGFMHMFYPHGVFGSVMLLLGIIEVMSWIFRVFSLALRLLANMIAGHVLLYCVAFIARKFIFFIFSKCQVSLLTLLYSILPVCAFSFLLLFESFVALLQAYIFLVLSCIYINEVYN